MELTRSGPVATGPDLIGFPPWLKPERHLGFAEQAKTIGDHDQNFGAMSQTDIHCGIAGHGETRKGP